ncbi:MAG: small, acid-soluble spore protein, alpha/beta type [Bacillota bacterium]
MARNTNNPVNPLAAQALDKMKVEIANELGIQDYQAIDKGQLTSRENGYVGGNMTKKMVRLAEDVIAQDPQATQNITQNQANLDTPQNNY